MPLALADLTHDESLALIGLLKIMIEADKRFGLKESAALQLIADRVGRKLFNQLTDDARARFPDRESLKRHAEAIARPEARALIHTTLMEMAHADDELRSEEASILRWLEGAWKLG